MATIKECFDEILRGERGESRLAARKVSKVLYSSQGDETKFKEIAAIVAGTSETYSYILEDWRQENFVMAVSVIYFLHDKESHLDLTLRLK